ncbi:unnamed protein product [Echinostoma caproni]|uniref:Nuclear pore glycoprotein p62 n=1 Tax=Echinostoma caproni TaxID=27848 RepID=A0A183AZI1_9TREM|nr:unnamed protein product [Echinostoma caproni]
MPLSTSVTSASSFTFGQKPLIAPTTATASLNTGFQGFGAPSTIITSANTTKTTSSAPFQFSASPTVPNSTGFNFSSSLGSTVNTASVPSFGNTAGFNFGQAPSFSTASPGTTNPFAFGTTPPPAPGAANAVAVPRRRPASARRTRRM